MIVVDASLAAKWILWEDQSHDALTFLAKHRVELCAPDLVLTEVAGAITRIARDVGVTLDDTEHLLSRWLGEFGRVAIDVRPPTPALVLAAARLSIALSHPIQDCLYLALAIDLDVDLATCDVKFAKKAQSQFSRVRLLADYGD